MHDDTILVHFVIPGLTKPAPYLIRGNPVLFWIPAGVYPVFRYGAGMTRSVVIHDAVYRFEGSGETGHDKSDIRWLD